MQLEKLKSEYLQNIKLIDICKSDAQELLKSKWWVGKSDFEIVKKQIYIKGLTSICDYYAFLIALENVLERLVLEDEFSHQELLVAEFEKKFTLK